MAVVFRRQEALWRRLAAINEDEVGRREKLEVEVQGWLPEGATVELENVTGWEGSEEPLRAEFSVEIPNFTVKTGRRLLLAWTAPVSAGVPKWLRALAQVSLPDYSEDTDAVMLLDEKVTTVEDNGEINTRYRRAYKILRSQGRKHGHLVVYFDNERQLTSLKAWSISAQGKEYEVKEKDAVETSIFGGALYQDTRRKALGIPAAEPGNVIGYEYEQKGRSFVLQDRWLFQYPQPVHRARYALELPAAWEFEELWVNYPAQEPQQAGKNRWVWELEDIPAVESEPLMPPWRAVAGWLAVNFYPRREDLRAKSHANWHDVGLWYAELAAGRRQATPEIRDKVAELTSGAATELEKLRELAKFVQQKVRYVAIEIGIGGYQTHSARDVFANLYGDCKDKATLLSTMLREIGIESYYVLINSRRGVLAREFPSMLNFNHVILAIRLPEHVPTSNLYSVREHERLGRLLFFDPTDRLTRLGYLPAGEQANFGLLVTDEGSELVKLSLLRANSNRLLRVAKLQLSPTGTLTGVVQEIRWGVPAVYLRAQLLATEGLERHKVLEDFLANSLGDFVLRSAEVENLEEFDEVLVVRYRFEAQNYAKAAGKLLLVRPRVLGEKSTDLLERKERKHPLVFSSTTQQSDIFEIHLPSGYTVDEIPPGLAVDSDFAEYRSQVEVEGDVLKYRRTYTIKDVLVPIERLGELKDFFRQVADDERQSAVLQRSAP